VPAFTLGVVETNPLSMAEAFATFAARGVHCPSTPVTEVRDRGRQRRPLLPTAVPAGAGRAGRGR
jgi:membrane carboxypeptidase/penicillin-binding protein